VYVLASLSERVGNMSEQEDQMLERATGDSGGISEVATEGSGAAGADGELLTVAQVEEFKARAAKADEYWDRLLRAQAELENYRKRALRERQDAIQSAQATLLGGILPALDSFDMALAAIRTGETLNLESLKTGLELAYSQLKTALSNAGLEEIDAARQVFDPNVHEALSQLESAEVAEGHVLQQLRKGYRLKERLIRPASVIVAKKPAA
jgi:molecular chaperone GrpE